MKTFLQYLEEKKMAGYALASIIGGTALGLAGKGKQPEQQKQIQQPTATQATIQSQPQTQAPVSTQTQPNSFHEHLKKKYEKEYDTIMDAAVNNGISKDDHENLSVLFAIRKAENGGPGVEFGVLHPKAKGTNLRTQAGWAAATIMKNRGRHNPKKDVSFIKYLGAKYAPKNAENDPKGLNTNWIDNVTAHYNDNISTSGK
jgi:hypothetical protein